MDNLKDYYNNLSSSELIKKRAYGDQLSGKAHQVIEIILNERGVNFPPLPKSIIDTSKENFIGRSKKSSLELSIGFAVGIILLIITNIFSKTITHTTFGFLTSVLCIAYYVFEFFRKANQSTKEREEEEKVKKIEEDGVSDLMLASAEGDLQRSKDLVAYGANVNATSYNGSTALMYAARNNHLSIVKLLIENGADKEIENEKKSTALSLSQTYNSNEVNEYLKSLSFKL